MHPITITIVTVIAVLLVHFSYVDFRFRYRDGIRWFWTLNPAPPLMWIARILFIATVVAAFCGPFIGINATFGWLVAGLMALHFVALILLEVLEPR